MPLSPREVLDFHRQLVAIPSVSHQEAAAAAFVADFLERRGRVVERIGGNVVAFAGRSGGRRLLLDSHLDTVPPSGSWSRDPWQVVVEEGRVYGLGSNDAKASVAAMVAAFLTVEPEAPVEVGLLLVVEEETGGEGTELAWPALERRGWVPDGVVVGEPTGLHIAVAQKGLLILELAAVGDPCHAANAAARGARNAGFTLAHDLVAVEALRHDLGPDNPLLGRTSLEVTVIAAGTARNVLPDRATAILDLRTVPGVAHDELVERLRGAVDGEVRVISDRLVARRCSEEAAVVRAARAARPEARLFGSSTMSDLVFFAGVPAIKVGPGESDRSHTPDEHVLEEEILAGAEMYRRLIEAF